jgi:hypothetical protein
MIVPGPSKLHITPALNLHQQLVFFLYCSNFRTATVILKLMKLKLKLIYDRQPVGQSVLVSGAHLGPVTNFSFSIKFPSDGCVFVIL